jgi:hypothetical protein
MRASLSESQNNLHKIAMQPALLTVTDITLHSTWPVMPKQEGTRQPAYQGDDAIKAGSSAFCIATPHEISQTVR